MGAGKRDTGFYTRRVTKAGVDYLDGTRRITSAAAVRRLSGLRIPLAYRGVLIAKDPRSRVQATGLDSRNRKQYVYRKAFVADRQAGKFKSLSEFGATFERIDRHASAQLRAGGATKSKVIAVIVRLIIDCGFRTGNPKYVRLNRTYGTSTLLCKHVDVLGNHVRICFRGKKNIVNEGCVSSPAVVRFLTELKRRCSPEQRIFAYTDDASGTEKAVTSDDVNLYLKQFGEGVTAKDLRGWMANKLFMDFWPLSRGSERERIKSTVEQVAERLHHTPAVCRKDYLHPDLLAAVTGCPGGR